MALGDLTLLLVGRDSLAEQLHVQLEHRGADIERADAAEALDTIRVAIPDLVIISLAASGHELERMRDALIAEAKPPRLLVLCEKKKAALAGTYKHDFIATLEPELGAELIASSIDSLCGLLAKQGARPLRSLIADVRRSQLPARPLAPIAAPPPAGATAAAKPADRPKPALEKPRVSAPPKPTVVPRVSAAPKPSVAPMVSTAPKPIASPKTLRMPTVLEARQPAENVPLAEPVRAIESVPTVEIEESEPITAREIFVPQRFFPTEGNALATAMDAPQAIATPTSVAASQPAAPVAVVTTPLVAELKPSGSIRARTLLSRMSRAQQATCAAALLALIGAASVSLGGDHKQEIATEAAVSLNTIAQQVATPPDAPALVSKAPAPPLAGPALPPVPAPNAAELARDAEDEALADGEVYDPKADPARARANFHVNAGHRLRKEGRLGMAEASYLKALEAMPQYARALSGLVAVHLARRDGVEALRWAKKLVAVQPKRGVHHRLLGDAYALTGQTGAAKQAWHQGSRLGDRVSRDRMR